VKNVIVEGPDGAGKSTLVSYLSQALDLKVHTRASSSKDGPVEDLAEWVTEQFRWHEDTGMATIYDRHPIISEPIYGPAIRNKTRPKFDDEAWIRLVKAELYKTSVVVWCRPPIEVVSANVTDSMHEQMHGVLANIGRVYTEYTMAYFRWRGDKRMYNYKTNAESELAADLKRMIEQ